MTTPASAGSEVLSIGRTLVDLYPTEDGPLEGVVLFEKAVGGSPTNVAIAAARLGRRAGMISRVGDDAFGRFARASLAAEGIEVGQVRVVAGGTTPIAIPEISPPDRFPLAFYRPEPPVDVAIDPGELDAEAVRAAGILWMSLTGFSAEPSRAAHRRVAELRAGAGPTVLDLDYRPAFWASRDEASDAARAALAGVDILIGNREECAIVTGERTVDGVIDALLAAGARIVVVKLGEDGVVAATRGERVTVAPIPVEVVNGLGAGDAFGGAFCHGLLSGWELEQTVRFANAAGALVASRRGCSTALPTADDVAALLAARG